MKVAPVMAALRNRAAVQQTLVHTGQHYDVAMSDRFFSDLEIQAPDVFLRVGSGSHAQQTAMVMQRFDEALTDRQPDMVVVYGDVNSTMAAALVAVKRGVAVAHVEAGLRSGDLSMPEEVNRLVTDRIAHHLYTPSSDANEHLRAEGVADSAVHLVGNVMIDTLVKLLPKADAGPLLRELDLTRDTTTTSFVLATLHRPSNVDDQTGLRATLSAMVDIASQAPVIFPVHPRTLPHLDVTGLAHRRVLVVPPLSYLEFLDLQRRASLVITDSGGVQEETTYLGVPCLTVRENTERPITVTLGTNELVGRDPETLRRRAHAILDGDRKQGAIPPLWDGLASQRIAKHLAGL